MRISQVKRTVFASLIKIDQSCFYVLPTKITPNHKCFEAIPRFHIQELRSRCISRSSFITVLNRESGTSKIPMRNLRTIWQDLYLRISSLNDFPSLRTVRVKLRSREVWMRRFSCPVSAEDCCWSCCCSYLQLLLKNTATTYHYHHHHRHHHIPSPPAPARARSRSRQRLRSCPDPPLVPPEQSLFF